MKERKVYTISVLFGTGKEWRFRDWGYYFDEVHAREVIEENQTDISELGYYQYGILSAKGEGPLAIDEPIQWYEFIWNEQQEFVRANKIDIPPQYEQQFLPVSSKAAEAPGGQRAEGCSCGSHDLAPLYHHPKCALAPTAPSERGDEPQLGKCTQSTFGHSGLHRKSWACNEFVPVCPTCGSHLSSQEGK